MDKELLAWMAGFVDGEGTITICSVAKNKTFVPKLAVSNTNYDSIKIFEDNFGGKVRLRKWENKKWKPCYEWSLTSRAACKAIEQLQPYLKIKNRQAEIVLELDVVRQMYNPSVRRWNPSLKKKVNTQFSRLKDKVQKLNKRGL